MHSPTRSRHLGRLLRRDGQHKCRALRKRLPPRGGGLAVRCGSPLVGRGLLQGGCGWDLLGAQTSRHTCNSRVNDVLLRQSVACMAPHSRATLLLHASWCCTEIGTRAIHPPYHRHLLLLVHGPPAVRQHLYHPAARCTQPPPLQQAATCCPRLPSALLLCRRARRRPRGPRSSCRGGRSASNIQPLSGLCCLKPPTQHHAIPCRAFCIEPARSKGLCTGFPADLSHLT